MNRSFRNKYPRSSAFIGCLLTLTMLLGCEADQGPSARERQQRALNDPFSYGPDADLMRGNKSEEIDPTDISGGKTSELDRKALKRDLDAVFNP